MGQIKESMSEISEKEFARILTEAKSEARKAGSFLSTSRMEELFAPLHLNEAQLKQIKKYFEDHGIEVGEKKSFSSALYEVNIPDAERERLLSAVVTGDGEAAKRFIEAHMPMVDEIAVLYTGQGVPDEDLVGEGYLALVAGCKLLEAVDTFNEAQQALSGMVMNAMEELINRTLEERKSDEQTLERVRETADKALKLAGEYHRELTVSEFIDETGDAEEELYEILRLVGGSLEGIDTKG